MIEMEKDKSDQQSMLRWAMAGTNDNRKSRAEDANTGREEGAQQKTSKREQTEEKCWAEGTTMNFDSMLQERMQQMKTSIKTETAKWLEKVNQNSSDTIVVNEAMRKWAASMARTID